MNAPRQKPAPNPGIEQALSHLKQAEVDLLAVVRTGSHPENARLLEAHAFLWEAISALSKVAAATD